MNKNAKKIGTMALVAVVAIGTYFVSGTYAKYTSKMSGNDKANVAKWAWNINGKDFKSANDLTESYTFDLFNTIKDTKDSANETDVADDLIAPGTTGSFEITITNNSEVNATYAIDFTETKSDTTLPIEYSLDGANWKKSANEIDIAASETDTKLTYNGSTNTVTKKVYWRWAFEGSKSTNYTSAQTDETDTALGFAANTTAPTVEVKAEVTVTQID